MSDIKLSVIAPMYNEEAVIELFLEKTVDVLDRNFTNYELILIEHVKLHDNNINQLILKLTLNIY